MNISIFIDVKLNRNGVGSYFHDLSVFFKENNMNVKLYNPESINKICGSFAYPGDKTQRIVFPSYKEIEKDIKENRPDVLLFTFFGPITLAGMRIAKKYKIPYIYVMNSSLKEFIDFYYRGLSHFALQKSSSYVEKKLIKNAHHVVTVNSKMHEIPKKYNTQSVITLGTLIDSAFLKNDPTHLVNQINSILFFGRLAIEKNVDSFIQAAKQLPQLNFNIAGDGPLREMVEKKSIQITNLNYLGWVDRKEIINVIDSNDMVIMPSVFEAFGTVALEGLSRGRIVIVGENHGIREFEPLNQCLFNVDEFNSLKDAIEVISKFKNKKISDISRASLDTIKKYDSKTKQRWINLLKDVN